jgi:hypothetical protein
MPIQKIFNHYIKLYNQEELSIQRIKSYQNIVTLQTLIIIAALLLKDGLELLHIPHFISTALRDTVFLLLGGIYVFILWILISRFTRNVVYVKLILYTIFSTLLLAAFVVNPFVELFPLDIKRYLLLVIHSILFYVECSVIYYTIFDIFKGHRLSKEKIWGSACVFLMIGISFGSLYDIINIAQPGCMGVEIALGLESYTACIAYSMTIIGGHEAYPNAIPLITNIGIIQAVWSNLFVVLLVGRLLGKPEVEHES